MKSVEELYEGLTDDMKAKVRACKTTEELIDLAKSEGMDLPDEALESVAGGLEWSDISCKGTDAS